MSAGGGEDAAPRQTERDEAAPEEEPDDKANPDEESDDKAAPDEQPADVPEAKAEPKAPEKNARPEPEAAPNAAPAGEPAAPGGVLWTTQDFCFGDNQFGTKKVFLADGRAELVEPMLSDLVPSLGGMWYAYSQYDQARHQTLISVVDPTSLEVLFEKSLPNLLGNFIPHPKEKHLVLGILSVDVQVIENIVVVDLDKGQIVHRVEPTGLVDWTSDGRIMRMTGDGRRWMSEIGGEERELAKLELPTGYSAGFGFWISPDNKQLVIQLQRYANDAWSDDLWIGSMDGGALERLTKTTMTSYAVWSPDSRYIGFNVDPDIHAACGISFSPERWHQNARAFYVEASARNVSSADSNVFEPLGNGSKIRVLAWTAH